MDVDVLSGPSTSGREAAQSAAALGVDDRARFVVELEFVQCLANPFYLNWLAQNRYLDDPAFLNYLKYLEYWRQPQYARYIRYPHCLLMLQLLQREPFAKAIAVAQVADDIHTQQYYHWQHYRSNRIKEGTAAVEGAAVQQPPPTQPPQAPGAAV